jgi:hypothetical protein
MIFRWHTRLLGFRCTAEATIVERQEDERMLRRGSRPTVYGLLSYRTSTSANDPDMSGVRDMWEVRVAAAAKPG